MIRDRYENSLTTTSQAARNAYIEGVDRLISASMGAEESFQRAIDADQGFALGYAGLARAMQIIARGPDAMKAIEAAERLAPNTSQREQSHVAAMGRLLRGDGAYAAILYHLKDHPRDVLLAQPCTGVFGLIGFSGKPGREAEQIAFFYRLAPHYGDDWWFNALLAFAQVEAGQHDMAVTSIERSLNQNPRNAHGAHIRAHIYYERGETKAGFDYIDTWRKDYEKQAPLHCHISWHVALWAMEQGDSDYAWQVVEADVKPSGAWGPPINVLTDAASFLFRAELAGGNRRPDLWREVSDYARRCFPATGIAFADVHSALAHAMAGETEALQRIISDARGPAGDLVVTLADAFRSAAAGNWQDTINHLVPAMATHERIGGSRAQRDLLEFMLLAALLRTGQAEEARRLFAIRRPAKVSSHPVAGL